MCPVLTQNNKTWRDCIWLLWLKAKKAEKRKKRKETELGHLVPTWKIQSISKYALSGSISDLAWIDDRFMDFAWTCNVVKWDSSTKINKVYHTSANFGFENFETSKFAAAFFRVLDTMFCLRLDSYSLDSSTVSWCFWILHWSFCGFVSKWRWNRWMMNSSVESNLKFFAASSST